MNEFRVFLAISVFSFSCYFLVDIVVYDFSWAVLIGSIIGLLSCHYIWPENHKRESRWYDLAEFVLELPYQAVLTLFRFLVNLIKGLFHFDF